MAVYLRGMEQVVNSSSSLNEKRRSRRARGRWALAAAVSLTTAAVWSEQRLRAAGMT
jgi:hypothetical protein